MPNNRLPILEGSPGAKQQASHWLGCLGCLAVLAGLAGRMAGDPGARKASSIESGLQRSGMSGGPQNGLGWAGLGWASLALKPYSSYRNITRLIKVGLLGMSLRMTLDSM